MSRPQEQQRPFLPLGNPFRMLRSKGSHLSPKLLDLLNAFEESLAGRINKLIPAEGEDVLSLSWMKSAAESLSQIHADIKVLITALELPVCDWDDKWIDVYLDNSVKLLDICIAFSSEISRLKHGNLFLQSILHNLGSASSNQFVRTCSSMDGWKQHISSKNHRLDKCFSVMDSLAQTLDLPKTKASSKGKVLMRAIYGVKAVTLFICSIFASAFSSSAKMLMDIQLTDSFLWTEAFYDVQTFVNTEIRHQFSGGRVMVLKELEAVDSVVKKIEPIVKDEVNPVEAGVLKRSKLELQNTAEKFSQGLDLLAKEVDSFFQVVLSGRDSLLGNLRVGGIVCDKSRTNLDVDGQVVR